MALRALSHWLGNWHADWHLMNTFLLFERFLTNKSKHLTNSFAATLAASAGETSAGRRKRNLTPFILPFILPVVKKVRVYSKKYGK